MTVCPAAFRRFGRDRLRLEAQADRLLFRTRPLPVLGRGGQVYADAGRGLDQPPRRKQCAHTIPGGCGRGTALSSGAHRMTSCVASFTERSDPLTRRGRAERPGRRCPRGLREVHEKTSVRPYPSERVPTRRRRASVSCPAAPRSSPRRGGAVPGPGDDTPSEQESRRAGALEPRGSPFYPAGKDTSRAAARAAHRSGRGVHLGRGGERQEDRRAARPRGERKRAAARPS